MSQNEVPVANAGKLTPVASSFVMLIGCLGLFGWLFGNLQISSLGPYYIPMAQSTGVCFLLLGLVLLIRSTSIPDGVVGSITIVIPVMVLLFGVLVVIGFYFGTCLTLEDRLHAQHSHFGEVPLNRMSPLTGCLFFFSALSMLLDHYYVSQRAQNKHTDSLYISVLLALSTAFVGFTILLGYVYGTPFLYAGPVIPVAPTTALGFFFLGITILSSLDNDAPLMRYFRGGSTASLLVRRFVPLVVAALIVQGLAYRVIPLVWDVSNALLSALLAAGFTILFVALTFHWGKRIGNRIDDAETRLRESQQRFVLAMEAAEEGLWDWDVPTGDVYYSSGWAEILGYSLSEVEAKYDFWESRIHPEDRDKTLDALRAHLAGHSRMFVSELRLLTKHGKWKWILGKGRVVERNADGSAKRVLGTMLDIHERIAADEALRQSREMIRAILASAPVGISLNQDRVIKWTNEAWVKLFGFTNDRECIGLNASVFYPALEEFERVGRRLFPELEKGRIASTETILQRNDGTPFQANVRMQALDPHDLTKGIIAAVTDISERSEFLRLLDSERERFKALAENSPFGLVTVQSDGTFSYVNQTFRELFGYDLTETPNGRQWFRKAFPDASYRHKAISAWFEAVETNVKRDAEPRIYTVTCRDGTEKTIHFRLVKLESGDSFLTCEDIGELMRMGKALEAERNKAQMYLDTAGVVLVSLDANGDINLINRKGCEVLGYQHEEIMGLNWFDVCLPVECRKEVKGVFDKLMGGDIAPVEYFENPVLTRDGERRTIAFHNKVIRDASQRIVGIFFSGEDITTRKRAEQELHASRTFLEQIVENIPNMIFVKDAENLRFVRFNKAGEELLGYAREELIGKSDYDFFPREQADFFIAKDRQVLARGRLVEITEEEIDTILKGKRTLHTKKIPIVDEHGVPQFLLGISEDITDRKRAEQDRESLTQQLLQSQKMEAIGTLSGGIAHDFNNILQVISGYTELLSMDAKPNEVQAERIRRISIAASRGADLVQRLLTFSRKDYAKPRLLNLNREVTQAMKLLERTIPRMIAIEPHLEDNLAAVSADPVQVEQILMNLAVNAKDAMPQEGGRLTIETKNVDIDDAYCRLHMGAKPGPHVMLSVADTGCGMTPETVQHIFEPFFTTKDVGKGTGLGLSVVFGIVKQHGGPLTCESVPGKGTTFRIYFPVTADELQDATEQDVCIAAGGSETILLVDDEEAVIDIGARVLTLAGYTVFRATSGPEAIEVYKNQHAHISMVVLDLIMPEMGGIQCYHELKRINPDVRVVISSGLISGGTAKDAEELGARGFVQKPYDSIKFLNIVREVLDAG